MTSEPTAPEQTGTPAAALGPTALVLGTLSAVGTWVYLFPWTVIAGGLAVTLGAMGIHHARHGAGRLWAAVAGTALGAMGFFGTATLLWAMA